jgi:hypothetical protein
LAFNLEHESICFGHDGEGCSQPWTQARDSTYVNAEQAVL